MIRRALHTTAVLSLLLATAATPPIDALEQLEDILPEVAEPGFFELSSWAGAARRAMEAEQYDEAIAEYRKLRAARPDLPPIGYNEAIAHYLNGDLDTASQLFSEVLAASEDSAVATRAAHNLLSATHRRAQPAIEQLSQQQQQQQQPATPPAGGSPPPPALDPQTLNRILEETPRYLDEAMEQFARSLDVDPDDLDARVDGERAQGLMKQIRELMQQQPQEGDQQQDQDEQQNEDEQQQDQQQPDENQDPQQQDQPQQDQPQQDDDQQQQQPQQDQPQQDDDQQQQQQQQEQQQEDQQQQQQQQDQPQQDQQPQPEEREQDEQQESQASSGDEEQERPMTPEEARRLLQQVRDKEQRRREELARRERADHVPAEKDW